MDAEFDGVLICEWGKKKKKRPRREEGEENGRQGKGVKVCVQTPNLDVPRYKCGPHVLFLLMIGSFFWGDNIIR